MDFNKDNLPSRHCAAWDIGEMLLRMVGAGRRQAWAPSKLKLKWTISSRSHSHVAPCLQPPGRDSRSAIAAREITARPPGSAPAVPTLQLCDLSVPYPS